MTITLKPETERALREAAARQGITVDELIDERLRDLAAAEDASTVSRLRREAIAAAQAQVAHVPGSTADFMARKAEEKTLEERRWNTPLDEGSTP